ncbi:MAG TPA: hypothetical protein VFP27_17900 [Mycobacterium sp.]|nr:hypothetical protein [Mycobacterium sp.]
MAAPDAVSAAVATAQDVVDKAVCVCGHLHNDHALEWQGKAAKGRPRQRGYTVCMLCAGECTRFRAAALTVWATRDATLVLEFLRELARDYEMARTLLARLDR